MPTATGDTDPPSKPEDWEPSGKQTKNWDGSLPSKPNGPAASAEPTNTGDAALHSKPEEWDPSTKPTARGDTIPPSEPKG